MKYFVIVLWLLAMVGIVYRYRKVEPLRSWLFGFYSFWYFAIHTKELTGNEDGDLAAEEAGKTTALAVLCVAAIALLILSGFVIFA